VYKEGTEYVIRGEIPAEYGLDSDIAHSDAGIALQPWREEEKAASLKLQDLQDLQEVQPLPRASSYTPYR